MKKTMYLMIGLLLCSILWISSPTMAQETKPIFRYGVSESPETIDPALAIDSESILILDHVLEGLVAYNLTDPELSIIPRLATNTGTWNTETTEATFHLREGVTFHDGTPFNASMVKYSFDRLTYLLEEGISPLAYVYEPLVQLYPDTPLVINETVIIDEFTVKFVLNYPFVPLIPLLCFSGSYIVPPNMPWNHTIEKNETLCGTGPYILESCGTEEIVFETYPAYWRPQPAIQQMIWHICTDVYKAHQDLMTGKINMINGIIPDYHEELETYSAIAISHPQPQATIECIAMNNKLINKTFRQAISYAFDYDVYINEIKMNTVVRLTSPIPQGILFHDPTVEPITHDLIKARQLLVDAGLGGALLPTSPNTSWMNLAETSPITTLNYTYISGAVCRDCAFHSLLNANLKLIGIKLELCGLSWSEYLTRLMGDFDKLQLFKREWSPDYNDPISYLYPLFSNQSLSNSAQVDDPWLEKAIQEALILTNESTRREKYSEIQHYIVEYLMPFVFLDSPTYMTAYHRVLGNYHSNPVKKLDFYAYTWYSTSSETSSTTSPVDDRSIPGYTFLVLFGLVVYSTIIKIYHTLDMKKKVLQKDKN